MAANATFALKPGVWFLRVRFVIFAPDSRREPSPPSGRKSTQPTVQILEASSELLRSFTAALTPLAVLDRFKLAGVVATWWTETLPDLKTLIENGFPGVVDGWLDAIADAVEDDDNV